MNDTNTSSSHNPIIMSTKQLSCDANKLPNQSDILKPKALANTTKVVLKSNLTMDNSSKAQKVLSFKQLRLINQENEIQCLKNKMEVLLNENKALRIQNVRQEKELINIDNQDLNIAKLIEQHEAEIVISKEQLRKTKAALLQEQTLRKELSCETVKLRAALYKSKEIIAEKGLIEKLELKKQLDEALSKVASTKNLLEVTQNKLEYLDGNYKVELTNCRKHAKSFSEKCEELESKINFLTISLKEKEKLLEIQNIYSNRFNMVKLSKRCEESILCPNCKVKWKVGDSHFRQVIEDKEKCDLNQSSLNIGKKEATEFNKNKIIEDVRKMITDEIKLGNFTIIYNPSTSFMDKSCFSIKPLTIETKLESPYITDETIENEKSVKEIHIDSKENNVTNFYNKIIENEKSNLMTTTINILPSTVTKSLFNTNELPRLTKAIPKPNLISNPTQDEMCDKDESKLKFMYPNNDPTIKCDDWWDDLETISVLNAVCDVKNRSYDVISVKDKRDFSKLSNENERPYTSLQFMYKLPKPVIEDLKDRESLIDKNITNMLSEQRIDRICVGNVNQKNVSFKFPLHSFLKNNRLHPCS